VASISVWEAASYILKDGIEGTYSAAQSAYRNPNENAVYSFEQKDLSFIQAAVNFQPPNTYSEVLEIRTKAENPQQARLQAQAAVYVANRSARTGRVVVAGNPLFVAGNNVDLVGFGELSGKYAIASSRHAISKNGYTTSLEL
jgi:phage protein D